MHYYNQVILTIMLLLNEEHGNIASRSVIDVTTIYVYLIYLKHFSLLSRQG
jgi:hypothetical protein